MVTLETLQIINADLDSEERTGISIRIGNTKSMLKNVKSENKESAVTEQGEDDNLRKTDPNDTEHMKLLNEMISFFGIPGKMLGVEFDSLWDWRKQKRFFFSVAVLLAVYTCMAYTVYVHYVNGDYVRILEPLAISGVAISCTQKLFVTLEYFVAIVALISNYRFISRRTAEGTRAEALKAGCRRTLRIMKVFTFALFGVVSVFFVVPVKVYILERELTPLIPMKIPYCDLSTPLGFTIGSVIQAIMGIFANVCTVVFGLVFITVIYNYILGVELLAEDFKDLDKMWTGKIKVSVAYRHAFLRNICQKRQDMNCFLDWTEKIYKRKLILYFCANYFGQIISLYHITIHHWQGGYGPFCGLLIEMFFYCYMGTKIHICTDKLCYIIYDTKWYEYDLLSQRTVAMLLKEAQITKDIQLGFIGPLNMITFIQIVKSMYSYYTVVTEML